MMSSPRHEAWALAFRLFVCEGPVLEVALQESDRCALAYMVEMYEIKPHKVDLSYVLCPYCQLLRGPVEQGADGLVCRCPDCGPVQIEAADRRAWNFDADWMVRKLRGALAVSSQEGITLINTHVWHIGSFQKRPVVLTRSLDYMLHQPGLWGRVSKRGSPVPWLVTPKPLRNIDHDPCPGSAVWLPMEERFTLYGGNLHFTEPGASHAIPLDDTPQAVHGPFSADFRWVMLPDWPHGPIALSLAQGAVLEGLWQAKGQSLEGDVVMRRAGLGSDKPIDVFKVKAINRNDPRYQGPGHAYKMLVQVNRGAGTYAIPRPVTFAAGGSTAGGVSIC